MSACATCDDGPLQDGVQDGSHPGVDPAFEVEQAGERIVDPLAQAHRRLLSGAQAGQVADGAPPREEEVGTALHRHELGADR